MGCAVERRRAPRRTPVTPTDRRAWRARPEFRLWFARTRRWRPAPAWCTRRPATARTTTSSDATRPAHLRARRRRRAFTAEVPGPGRAPVFEANPRNRRALAERGLPAQQAGRDRAPPVPALLALQEADHLPRDRAVVRASGRSDDADEPAQPGAGRDRPTQWIPAWGRRPHPRHDRGPPRLVPLAPARRGACRSPRSAATDCRT